MKKAALLLPLLMLINGISCTTLKLGVELLFMEFDGTPLIENEENVRITLETILLEPEAYIMTGYTRKVFSPEVKKTATMYHSFYTVRSSRMPFFTLSFSGTAKWFYSQGVWAMNTNLDTTSYIDYIYGDNEWGVEDISPPTGINTEMTIQNILDRMYNDINYYYNDHKTNRKGRENCNTALSNTIVAN